MSRSLAPARPQVGFPGRSLASSGPGARLRAHWRLKAALSIALPVIFCVPYFALQRYGPFEPRRLEPGWIDRLAGFEPGWVWVYQSAYLLFPVYPWLALSRRHLARYAAGFVAVSMAGFSVFALFPVAGPRPEVLPDHGLFRLLASYDAPTNAFPSLHCGLAAYAVLFGGRAVVPELPRAARGWLLAAAWAWVILIAYSTLATKQHYFVDVPAGILLAWAGHRLAWSWSTEERKSR